MVNFKWLSIEDAIFAGGYVVLVISSVRLLLIGSPPIGPGRLRTAALSTE